MRHEISIFLANILKELGIKKELAVNIYNLILVRGGDIILPQDKPIGNILNVLSESDYFNCLHNTKMADGNYMTKESAEIIANALLKWKPMETNGKLIP